MAAFPGNIFFTDPAKYARTLCVHPIACPARPARPAVRPARPAVCAAGLKREEENSSTRKKETWGKRSCSIFPCAPLEKVRQRVALTNAIGSRLLSTRPAWGGRLLLRSRQLAVFKRRPASLPKDPPSKADFCPGGALRGEAVRVGRSERAAVLVRFRRGRAGESDPGAESCSRPDECQRFSLALEQAKPPSSAPFSLRPFAPATKTLRLLQRSPAAQQRSLRLKESRRKLTGSRLPDPGTAKRSTSEVFGVAMPPVFPRLAPAAGPAVLVHRPRGPVLAVGHVRPGQALHEQPCGRILDGPHERLEVRYDIESSERQSVALLEPPGALRKRSAVFRAVDEHAQNPGQKKIVRPTDYFFTIDIWKAIYSAQDQFAP